MQAEIITIGDEILIGQIVDTNSAWLGRALGDAGICVARITSVGDRAGEITDAVRAAMKRTGLVLLTGGLGPTGDDITKPVLAQMFGMKLVRNEEAHAHIGKMLAARGMPFNKLNRSQALLPDGCTPLPNPNGTAPGMWFERDGNILVSMPGVPAEMKEMVEREVLPRLRGRFPLKSNTHRTALTFGLPESVLAETIAGWEVRLPAGLRLAYLPGRLGVRLRLSSYESDAESAAAVIGRQFAQLEKIIPPYIVGYGDISLELVAGALLRERGETVAAAESCTGGCIACRFTAGAGASDFFRGGVIAYANAVKCSLLDVNPDDIAAGGAVSRTVAEQMADGVRRATGSTYGLSSTGVAGPGGGTPEKPVGTVWIALSTPQGTFAEKRVFGQLRSENIEHTSSAAINLLRLYLKGFLT